MADSCFNLRSNKALPTAGKTRWNCTVRTGNYYNKLRNAVHDHFLFILQGFLNTHLTFPTVSRTLEAIQKIVQELLPVWSMEVRFVSNRKGRHQTSAVCFSNELLRKPSSTSLSFLVGDGLPWLTLSKLCRNIYTMNVSLQSNKKVLRELFFWLFC